MNASPQRSKQSQSRAMRLGLRHVVITAVVLAASALPAPTASALLSSTDSWAAKANDLCRSASDHYFDLTAPDAVLHGRVSNGDDVRATGDYFEKVSRQYKSVTVGVRRLGSASRQAKSLTPVAKAFDAATVAAHQVFLESRSSRARAPQDNPRFSQTLTNADEEAGHAGELARKFELAECVILFEGGVADHQNTSIGASPARQCGNVDPGFFDQDGAEYNPQFVPCTDPHIAEQYASTEYPAGPATPFPGENQLYRFGDDLCGARFKSYVGIDQSVSTLDYDNLTPDSNQWTAGDHSVDCILFDANHQPISGSMKGSGR